MDPARRSPTPDGPTPMTNPIGRAPQIVALAIALTSASPGVATAANPSAPRVDFNREIRPILSNRCFLCHGPDPKNRKGVGKPLRLDTEAGATADLNGVAAIVRGKPAESEVIARVTSDDPAEVMPPPGHGERLSPREAGLLARWIEQGAPYAKHWAYVKPSRPPVPSVRDGSWPRTNVDRFILARLESEGLAPSPEADRPTLIRRVSLDLTGLPPTPEEVDRFVADTAPDAYDRLVDRLLARPTYGEHWGKAWLDLARYADSAGYADDPARTIWAYRDYVVRSFNENKPFDRFTLEQVAGDLLPGPGDDRQIATAFHRNTLTNNEGGTDDEEFRNVAVVDRVNTTMAVWMGSTMACAQCHDHKYDPLSQAEYFKIFAFFNNTEDADRADESPVLPIFSPEQKARRAAIEADIASAEAATRPTPATLAAQKTWEDSARDEPAWTAVAPSTATARSGAKLAVGDDKTVRAESKAKTDIYTLRIPITSRRISAIRLEALADPALPGGGPGHGSGNFVVSRVSAAVERPASARPVARYVRVELPGRGKILSMAEVQVFRGADNVARGRKATQSSLAFDGRAGLAVDGQTDGRFAEAKSTTHTDLSDDPWWEVDLGAVTPIDRVAIWNRTDNSLHTRLADFRVILLNDDHWPIETRPVATAPNPTVDLTFGGPTPVAIDAAVADFEQPGFPAADVLKPGGPGSDGRGWAVGGAIGKAHAIALVPASPVAVEPGSVLILTVDQTSKYENHTIGRLRVSAADDPRAGDLARIPASVAAALKVSRATRSEAHAAAISAYYLGSVAPDLKAARDRLAGLKAGLAAIRPETTVPVLRELGKAARRTTKVQRRGNFMDLGETVAPGVPEAFPPLPAGAPADRLALARWLVDPANPLTARVVANRYWEAVFGTGIVATSEEFGAQGDLPSHPELLDWLATELVRDGWDLKRFLRLLVTSAAYRQSSRVTPEGVAADPDNRLLARGPRFRLSAETIRDQALAVAGLLSPKTGGPPVKPPQPSLGLTAAFGSGVDWQTSPGEDRYRRGIYTTWRRSSPYPSMATFDAPNREVCTLRRTRTNTPLQALVTLNDPVYVEAAQGLARRMIAGGPTPRDRVRIGVRLALSRVPTDPEADRLVRLFEASRSAFAADPAAAAKVATDPIGPAPKGADLADLAAWTVVGNVLMNLDEFLMKR